MFPLANTSLGNQQSSISESTTQIDPNLITLPIPNSQTVQAQATPSVAIESLQLQHKCDNDEDVEGNPRYILNKAMGVDPTDRAAVQARRQ